MDVLALLELLASARDLPQCLEVTRFGLPRLVHVRRVSHVVNIH